MNNAFKTAADRYGRLIGEHIVVTFADGQQEAGVLTACGWDLIEVEHTYGTPTGVQFYTATYSLIGDDDTPRVVAVDVDAPQREALFA